MCGYASGWRQALGLCRSLSMMRGPRAGECPWRRVDQSVIGLRSCDWLWSPSWTALWVRVSLLAVSRLDRQPSLVTMVEFFDRWHGRNDATRPLERTSCCGLWTRIRCSLAVAYGTPLSVYPPASNCLLRTRSSPRQNSSRRGSSMVSGLATSGRCTRGKPSVGSVRCGGTDPWPETHIMTKWHPDVDGARRLPKRCAHASSAADRRVSSVSKSIRT